MSPTREGPGLKKGRPTTLHPIRVRKTDTRLWQSLVSCGAYQYKQELQRGRTATLVRGGGAEPLLTRSKEKDVPICRETELTASQATWPPMKEKEMKTWRVRGTRAGTLTAMSPTTCSCITEQWPLWLTEGYVWRMVLLRKTLWLRLTDPSPCCLALFKVHWKPGETC